MSSWNIFASTLADILTREGYSLNDLRTKAAIHPEVVRRLKQSLSQPKICPVLNPDDLEETIRVFQLDEHDTYLLYAAVLTAAVQEELMRRMNEPSDVLLAIREILPILFRIVWKHKDDSNGLGGMKSVDEEEEGA